ncbi:MAG TPA: radical SAM family heme chaperone HemW [Gemmatimonadaceae bacterium]|nr:radical SAM family heme chaperone HemW [Gemmatimonadaceae bacterium]
MTPPRHAYVHVPFCARRCTYCDFAIAVRRSVPVDEYLAALGRELDIRRPLEGARLDTLYFGGGTPSRLGGEGIARAVELVRRHARLADDAEVTIEANPEDVNAAAVSAWRAAGVNRVSLGVQSFDDETLRWMHRVHDAERARRAVEEIREGGIANISLDLIFALPASLPRSWRSDVEQALALAPSHVSLYGLTIEERTPLGKSHGRGEVDPASDERYEEDFLFAHEAMTAAGLEHYEVSNFGVPDSRSRHNSAYWRHVPYAGLGPGAHELELSNPGTAPLRRRRWNDPAYVSWAHRLERGEDPIEGCETLTAENESAESVYLGLRTREGLTLRDDELPVVERWVAEGWGEVARDGAAGEPVLRLTPLGWLRLDALAASLTTIRSR